MNKIYPNAAAAIDGVVRSGQLLAVGGFGLCGIPEALIDAADRAMYRAKAAGDSVALGEAAEAEPVEESSNGSP